MGNEIRKISKRASDLTAELDGKVWRLHSGMKADVVYEWKPEAQQ